MGSDAVEELRSCSDELPVAGLEQGLVDKLVVELVAGLELVFVGEFLQADYRKIR